MDKGETLNKLKLDIETAVRSALSRGNHFNSEEIEKINGMVAITLRGGQRMAIVKWMDQTSSTTSLSAPQINGQWDAFNNPPIDATDSQDEHRPLDLSVNGIRIKEEKPDSISSSTRLPFTAPSLPVHSPLPLMHCLLGPTTPNT